MAISKPTEKRYVKWALFLLALTVGLVMHEPAQAQIAYLVPDTDTLDIPLNTKVLVTFDRAMQAASITNTTFTIDNGIGYTVTYDGDHWTAILKPTLNLAGGTNFICTLTTAVKDASGNQVFANNVNWNFTTGATTNTTDLDVSSVSPGKGADGVSRSPRISVIFNKFINPATLDVASFYLKGIKGSVTYDPSTKKAVFLVNQELNEETSYTAVITTDVEDVYGNNLAADYTWNFSTESEGGCFINSLKSGRLSH